MLGALFSQSIEEPNLLNFIFNKTDETNELTSERRHKNSVPCKVYTSAWITEKNTIRSATTDLPCFSKPVYRKNYRTMVALVAGIVPGHILCD